MQPKTTTRRADKQSGPRPTANDLLTRAGFKIRGRRADCPHCTGHSRLTVSLNDDGLFYCHRCHHGGSVRQLARQQGVLLPPRIRKADKPKREFREWLARKMSEVADAERRLALCAEWAKVALAYFPDMQAAWDVLAEWYHARHSLERFWESASDRVGRFWLYRNWRRHAEAAHTSDHTCPAGDLRD